MVLIELRSRRSAAGISDVIGCGSSRSIAGPEIDGTRRLVHFVKIMRDFISQRCYERKRSHQQRSKVPKNTLHRRFCKNRVQRYNKKSIYANAKQEKFVLWQFLHIFSNGIRRKVLQKSYKSLIWVLAEFAKHAVRLMWKN